MNVCRYYQSIRMLQDIELDTIDKRQRRIMYGIFLVEQRCKNGENQFQFGKHV